MHKDPIFEALPAVLNKIKPGQDILAAARQVGKKPSAAIMEKAEADRRLALLKK
jgi:hypothetical protein